MKDRSISRWCRRSADRVSPDLDAPGPAAEEASFWRCRPEQGGGRGGAAHGDRRGGAHGAVKRSVRFTDVYNDSIAREQLLSALSGFFAGLALLLSGIGIYGLVAWNVTPAHAGDWGANGAGRYAHAGFALVMRQVLALLAVGVAAGGVAAFFAARSIRSFLFEVQPGSPSGLPNGGTRVGADRSACCDAAGAAGSVDRSDAGVADRVGGLCGF